MPKSICIAPGHGGFDPGAVGNGLIEKNVNLQIAMALRDLLLKAGVPVIMTRTTDVAAGGATRVQQDLYNQCAIANNAGVDLFFSNHVNAGGGHGAEIWVHPNSRVKDLASEIVQSVGSLMGIHGKPVKFEGVDGQHLYVIEHTRMPAMLLEIGFIDSGDAEKIRDHWNDIAVLIAKPLITWAGGDLSVLPTQQTEPKQQTQAQGSAGNETQAAQSAQPTKQTATTAAKTDTTETKDDIMGMPYAAAAQWAESLGLMTRDSTGAWRPDATVHRWELAVVLHRFYQVLQKESK